MDKWYKSQKDKRMKGMSSILLERELRDKREFRLIIWRSFICELQTWETQNEHT